MFLEAVEGAAGRFCTGSGNGRVKRPFDEKYDVQWRDTKFQERLREQAGECWKSGVGTSEPSGSKPASSGVGSAQTAQLNSERPAARAAASPAEGAGQGRRKRAARSESGDREPKVMRFKREE